MDTMPFASKKIIALTFLDKETTICSLEGVSRAASTALIVVWSLIQSGGPNTHPG